MSIAFQNDALHILNGELSFKVCIVLVSFSSWGWGLEWERFVFYIWSIKWTCSHCLLYTSHIFFTCTKFVNQFNFWRKCLNFALKRISKHQKEISKQVWKWGITTRNKVQPSKIHPRNTFLAQVIITKFIGNDWKFWNTSHIFSHLLQMKPTT